MQKPKAAVVTPGSFFIPSGRSSSVERVVEQMIPLVPEGFDIRIYGVQEPDHPSIGALEGGIPVHRLPRGSGYASGVIRSLQAWKPHVIDVQNRPGLAWRIKRALPEAKVVSSVHSLTYVSPPHVSRKEAERLLQSVDRIVVNSSFLEKELRNRYPLLKTPINVNPLGVCLQDFMPRWTPRSEALREAKLKDRGWQGRRIVMYVGRLLPLKGVHHVLEALPELIRAVPDVMVLIVGSPFYGSSRRTAYEIRLHELAALYPDHVNFVPFVPYPAISYWYHLADVVLVPSAEGEAFGLVNVEAMATGVPVIASDAGGIPEIVEDGVTGYVLQQNSLETELAPALIRLLRDEQIRCSFGHAGHQRAAQWFQWNHTAVRWHEMMRKLLVQ
ncbi:glycosyltransferase family 4 protein [Paenibacillus chibensis]|uniref:glycosyltransferase family 4 protein n=1 Tax=Paenibacillus chibensis TaxID=59846 RepID=UPI000FDAFFC0|nr:glycosyltransferase family 4 protein [Paenibacillus chibensis]MEC0372472.1 glycosyltransferase family 4 protein [Paenibacillus chibensis]